MYKSIYQYYRGEINRRWKVGAVPGGTPCHAMGEAGAPPKGSGRVSDRLSSPSLMNRPLAVSVGGHPLRTCLMIGV